MARVKRIRRGVVAVVAAAAVGGVVGSLPVVHHAQVQPTVTAIDPASLYNSAQQKFAAGDVAGGLESLKQSLIVAPADAESLALQSVWSDQVDDAATGKAALSRLSMINPTLATSVRNITAGVSAAAAIVPSTSPAPASAHSPGASPRDGRCAASPLPEEVAQRRGLSGVAPSVVGVGRDPATTRR